MDDLDLEIMNNEEYSSEPLFYSIMNVMNSMKEATADKIYQRIQKEGNANYSKPQVDRAIASALKYGIFEVRNNQYRLNDDILDDEDTIYWQALIKREKTPYRLENNRGDYIHPEKDRHTFRKPVTRDENSFTVGRIKGSNKWKTRKGKPNRQITPAVPTQNTKKCKQMTRRSSKSNNRKDREHSEKKSYPAPSGVKRERRIILGRIPSKDEKKLKRVPANNNKNSESRCKKAKISTMKNPNSGLFSHQVRNNNSEEFPKPDKGPKNRDKIKCEHSEEENEDEDNNDEDDYGGHSDDDTGNRNNKDEQNRSIGSQDKKRNGVSRKSYYFQCMGKPCAPRKFIIKKKGLCDSSKPTNCSDFTQDIKVAERNCCVLSDNENRNLLKPSNSSSEWNLFNKHINRNLLSELYNKADWLGNRPHYMQDGTVKQLDNALKIEPLDSLPFKNIEDASYIS